MEPDYKATLETIPRVSKTNLNAHQHEAWKSIRNNIKNFLDSYGTRVDESSFSVGGRINLTFYDLEFVYSGIGAVLCTKETETPEAKFVNMEVILASSNRSLNNLISELLLESRGILRLRKKEQEHQVNEPGIIR